MSNRKALTRRALLGGMSIGGASAFLAGGFAMQTSNAAQESAAPADDAWAYRPLTPREVAERAYDLYPEKSCMCAVFGAVVTVLGDKHGEPFKSFPIHMTTYGHGGVVGSGTICGTLNGAGAAIALFVRERKDQDRLLDGLIAWYRDTKLPIFTPTDGEALSPQVSPKSMLCHISSARWTEKAHVHVKSPERKERCRRLSADVAGRVVEILNNYQDGQFPTEHMVSALDQDLPAISKMRCGMCHGDED